MLHRDQRYAHARERAHLPCPLSGAVHHYLCFDVAQRGPEPGHATAFLQHRRDGALLHDAYAARACAAGQGHGDIGGICLAIGRQESCAHEVCDIHHGPELARLGGREEMHLEAEAVRGGGLAAYLGEARGVAGEA